MARPVPRSIGFLACVAPVVLVVTLAACGGDDDASSGSEVEIKPSSFVTTATTVTAPTTAPGAPPGEPGDTSPTEQSYEVQQGDGLYSIASRFGVEAEAIAEYNNWADGISHSIFAGDPIRIPPGAEIPSPDEEDEEDGEDTESTDEESTESDDNESETTEEADDPELCPDGERQGTYTIKAGDIPARVAEALNVTLDQLVEANANNSAYNSFIVGARINVPCGGDAEATDTTEE